MIKHKYIYFLIACMAFNLLAVPVQSQETKTIKGTVVDGITGLPLEGVIVNEEGVLDNTIPTNAQGQFAIQAKSIKSSFLFTFPGLQTKAIYLNGRDSIKVYMLAEEVSKLGRPVSLPYQEGVYLSNSVSAVSNKKVISESESGYSLEEVLKGNVSGVNIVSRSGKAGNGAVIDIRGISSLYTKNQPLVVVDGIIYENLGFKNSIVSGYSHNVLSDISIKDIENITIIKNGASLYGSKASNGVIIIQTKRPDEAKTTIDAYVTGGLSLPPREISMLDPSQHRNLLFGMFASQGYSVGQSLMKYPYMNNNQSYYYINNYTNNTNWQKHIFEKNSISQDFFFNVKGGDEIAKYALSVGYTDNGGIVKKTGFTRFNVRLNGAINITPKLEMIPNISYVNSNNDLFLDGATSTNIITTALRKSPMMAPNIIANDGSVSSVISDIDDFGESNPEAILDRMKAVYESNDFAGKINLKYKFRPEFTATASFAVNAINSSDELYIPMYGVRNDPSDSTILNTIQKGAYKYSSYQGEFYATYKKTFGQVHNVLFNAGARGLFNEIEMNNAAANNTGSDLFAKLTSAKSNMLVSGDIGKWNTMTTFASLAYNYGGKYYLTVNASMDGSSRIGKNATNIKIGGYSFGVFPSIEAAWRISSESFMRNVDIIDELKLRASYALTGNDDIGNYNNKYYYKAILTRSVPGLVRGNIPNDKLTWETTTHLNAGMDLSLAKERFALSVDVYQEETNDLFGYKLLPSQYGISEFAGNGGKITNKGIDVTAAVSVLRGKIGWDITANVSANRNKLTRFSSTIGYDVPTIYEIIPIPGGEVINLQGQPLGQFWGYRTNGIYRSQAEADEADMYNANGLKFQAGDVRFIDSNNDHIIDYNDKQIIGNPFPDFSGGFSSEFTYQNVSLRAHFTFSYGNDVYSNVRMNMESMKDYSNQTTAVLNRWVYDGQDTDIPRLAYNDPIGNSSFSDRWIEDGSYLRLSELRFTYKVPKKFLMFRNASFYVSGNNLFTLTKYLGYDPEFAYSTAFYGRGADYGMVPQYRSIFVGFRVGL